MGYGVIWGMGLCSGNRTEDLQMAVSILKAHCVFTKSVARTPSPLVCISKVLRECECEISKSVLLMFVRTY